MMREADRHSNFCLQFSNKRAHATFILICTEYMYFFTQKHLQILKISIGLGEVSIAEQCKKFPLISSLKRIDFNKFNLVRLRQQF